MFIIKCSDKEETKTNSKYSSIESKDLIKTITLKVAANLSEKNHPITEQDKLLISQVKELRNHIFNVLDPESKKSKKRMNKLQK